MTNICTKVTVRKRPIKNGQLSLYLDFYPPVRHPKTGKLTRREYLGIYIYANPTEKFEAEFNKTMLRNAELIKCRRTEAIINEEFGFLDRNRGKESFLEYFRSKMADDDNFRNWNTAYKHFEKYCGGSCTFDDLTVEYCQGFLTYMLSLTTQNKSKMMASTANNNLNKLKCVLRQAYEERRIKENIAPRLKHAKEANTRREFLTLDEVKNACQHALREASRKVCGSVLMSYGIAHQRHHTSAMGKHHQGGGWRLVYAHRHQKNTDGSHFAAVGRSTCTLWRAFHRAGVQGYDASIAPLVPQGLD